MKQTSNIFQSFTTPLLHWYDLHGRKDLPWQNPREAYRVWISEIMLQQTQVKTVIPYFLRFITQFPNIQALATAPEDQVLALWSGLGYYSRARNLKNTAEIIAAQGGSFPRDLKALENLPGIGPSTAAAIASLAFDMPTAILDGNVKRVLSRYFLIAGAIDKSSVNKIFWQYARDCMPTNRCGDYSQAIMDLGATLCTPKHPICQTCPLQNTCQAYQNNIVSNYPEKPLKKIHPIKHEQFLLLYSKTTQEIYLEKRPAPGSWGGLWCLPHLSMEQQPIDYLKSHQLNTHGVESWDVLKHTFTHFQLHLHPVFIHLETKSQASAATGKWFHLLTLQDVGLPVPIKTLIQSLIIRMGKL